jgi:branched-chain amino acid aminotransferase
MHFINFNGKILPALEPIVTAQSRGLRYGDGIFETIKLKNNKLILFDAHCERLFNGLSLLQFTVPKLLSPTKLQEEILSLAKKNKLTNARVRLTFFRADGGIYDAINHHPNYIIEAIALPESNGALNSNGLNICIYKDAKKTIDNFSNLKTNNYLPYVMGALFAKAKHCNDAIILNSLNNICDTTIANIFYIKDEVFFTPALTEGCVAGTMRHWIIKQIKQQGFTVHEKAISITELLNADEIFLSNAIYNIRWISNVEELSFTNKTILKLVTTLENKYKNIYC